MSQQSSNNESILNALDYWQVIRNRWGLILIIKLLIFVTVAVITSVMPRKYESSAVIEIRPREKAVEVNTVPGMSGLQKNMTGQFFDTETQKIKSRNALIKVVDKLDLTTKWNTDQETCVAILKGIVVTQNIRDTDLISISVRHGKKEDAKDIVEEVANAYKDYRTELENSSYQKAIKEFEREIASQEVRVEEIKQELYNITKTRGLIYWNMSMMNGFGYTGIDSDFRARDAISQTTKIEMEKLEAETRLANLSEYEGERLWVYASGLNLPDNTITALYNKYLTLQTEIQGTLASGLGPKHPTVVAKQTMLDAMKVQLDEAVVHLKVRLQGLSEMFSERLTKTEIRQGQTKEEAVGDSIDSQKFFDTKRRLESEQELLESLQIKQLSSEMDAKLSSDIVIVHDKPTISNYPVSPKVKLLLSIGSVVGLAFGIGIAFFLEYLDTSAKTIEDVERFLQIPVLAVIPKNMNIIHKLSGPSPDAEAYRILRTNLEFNRKNPEDNAITMVSGAAGEGKSTTLVNLAYICAQGGYTTLMIDADLRRPSLHTFFDINNSFGLTNYLTTELVLEDVILQTPIENLYFLPSGTLPFDAAGILNSRRMTELLQDVKQRFDLVLVDSPPILGVSDASVISSEVDLTIIIVQHRKLPRKMLERVKQAVENVGGRILGVVLNNVDIRSDSQYQYYTSYYTYYAPANTQSEKLQKKEKQSNALVSNVKSDNSSESDLY